MAGVIASSVLMMATTSASAFQLDGVVPALYGFTGFQDQQSGDVLKTSLYRIDTMNGDVELVVNFDDASVSTKPGNYSCLAGQAARMAVDEGTIFGMGGVDSPLIVHDLARNVSFCDDGVENMWGITSLGPVRKAFGSESSRLRGFGFSAPRAQNATEGRFAAFSSSFNSAFGQWEFEAGVLSLNNDVHGQAATFKTMLSVSNTGSKHEYFACAALNTDLQNRVAVDPSREHLYVACDDLLLTIDISVQQKHGWTVLAENNISSAVQTSTGSETLGKSKYSLSQIIAFYHPANALLSVGIDQESNSAIGLINTTSGAWMREPIALPCGPNPLIAYDSSFDSVYAYDSSGPCKNSDISATKLESNSSSEGACLVTMSLDADGDGPFRTLDVKIPIAITDLVYGSADRPAPAPAPAGKHTCGQFCDTDADCDQSQPCNHCENMILHQCVT
eukprot:INCI16948.1.p1 GENE.INCI16948.1~~INCI16948.1.p1  ORF type:complete len:448 (+),score=72.52 INCI16948.1:403-1746(+)